MGTRREAKDYSAVAWVRNARWLGPPVENANTRTEWQCRQCRHRWWTTYNSLRRGSACPLCAILKRARTLAKKPDDYHRLAEIRGLRWLGPAVGRTGLKTRWQCSAGHVWETSYDKIRWGRGCPWCARTRHRERSRRERHPPERYRTLARKHGLVWEGPEVTHANAKTHWRCRIDGYRWETTYHKINQGRGCPKCALQRRSDFFRHSPTNYHALARERGFRWLGPAVATVDRKTWWRCPTGHAWRSTYNSIQQGSGCHQCTDRVNGVLVSTTQRRLCRSLGGRLNVREGRYCIDVALEREGVRIAVEFDAWYFHGGRERSDLRRDCSLMDAGWRVLRIQSPGGLPHRADVEEALGKLVRGHQRICLRLPGWGEGPTIQVR